MKMNLNKKNLGFTLIELLVVVAIIGVLASVVLASLNTARSKGADAAIKSNLANIRTQAELQLAKFGCFKSNTTTACSTTVPAVFPAGACPTTASTTDHRMFFESTIFSQINGALNSGGTFDSCISTVGGGAWAVAVELKSDATKAWCVDSTGASKQIAHTAAYTQAALSADIVGSVCGS